MAKKSGKKLTAHVAEDGSIVGGIVQDNGRVAANLVPEPGIQVVEIENAELDDKVDADAIEDFVQKHRVKVTPAVGKLVKY